MTRSNKLEWELFSDIVATPSAVPAVTPAPTMVPLPRVRFIVMEESLLRCLLRPNSAPPARRVGQVLARASVAWPDALVVVAGGGDLKADVVRRVPAMSRATWVEAPPHLDPDLLIEVGTPDNPETKKMGAKKRRQLLVFHAVATAAGDQALLDVVEHAARGESTDDPSKSRLEKLMATGGQILSLAANNFSGRDEFENEHPDEIVCAGFGKLHLTVGCPYRCAYCYLLADEQMYRVPAFTRAYLNVEDAIAVLRQVDERARAAGVITTLNMGELGDTHAFEPVLQLLPPLLEDLAGCANVALAAVSKSGNPCPHVPLGSRGRVFDYRSVSVSGQSENKTAGPLERVAAAAVSHANGAVTRVRLDPPGIDCVQNPELYRPVVSQILRDAHVDRVILGTPRFSERQLIVSARSLTKYVKDLEQAVGTESDDWTRTGPKARPLSDGERTAFYRAVIEIIREEAMRLHIDMPDIWVCKESPAVLEALGLPAKGCCYDVTAPAGLKTSGGSS